MKTTNYFARIATGRVFQFENKNWIKTGVHWAKCLADNSERKFSTWELIQYDY